MHLCRGKPSLEYSRRDVQNRVIEFAPVFDAGNGPQGRLIFAAFYLTIRAEIVKGSENR